MSDEASPSSVVEHSSQVNIPDGSARLVIMKPNLCDVDEIVRAVKQDTIVLCRRLRSEQASEIVRFVADAFGLADQLTLHAGFAAFLGHRRRVGQYFMSVNNREDYQVIPPHSEGTGFQSIQLASFYCFENSTDGGETIFMNPKQSGSAWESLRERVVRASPASSALPTKEIARARALYNLSPVTDVLRNDDLSLGERPSEISGLILVDALAKPTKAYSRILGRDLYVYWDSIASIDHDSSAEYLRLLQRCELLRVPANVELQSLDSCAKRRIWYSGTSYSDLFACKIVRKLAAGDLIVYNNLTWTHAASNWTPGVGSRVMAAAFA